MGEPTPERGGRRKRLYRLEPAGAEAVASALRAVRRLAAGVERRLASRSESRDEQPGAAIVDTAPADREPAPDHLPRA